MINYYLCKLFSVRYFAIQFSESNGAHLIQMNEDGASHQLSSSDVISPQTSIVPLNDIIPTHLDFLLTCFN